MFGKESDSIYNDFRTFLGNPQSLFAQEFIAKQNEFDLQSIYQEIGAYALANNKDSADLKDNLRLAVLALFSTCNRMDIVDRFLTARKNCKNNNPDFTDKELEAILPLAEVFLVEPPTEYLFTILAPNVPEVDEWPMSQDRFNYPPHQPAEIGGVDADSQPINHDSIQVTINRSSGDIALKPRGGYKFKSITPTLQRPTVDENGNWTGQFRSGLVIEEIDINEEGNTSATTVYLYYVYEPTNRGWKLDVIDPSGNTKTYSVGQSTHQNVVDQREQH